MQRDFRAFFKNKTATLMGLGLLGRGVGDADFLAQHCKKVYVTDNKTADELRQSIDQLKHHDNIEFHLGGHDMAHFTSVDMVIKGAGVRLDNPYIAAAESHNIPVYMSTALFVYLSGIKTIGVTGTRGKSSTSYMIAHILEQAGKKVLLGGNIRGVSTLSHLPNASQYDLAVLELDSWQLQGFDRLGISPNISVFTTFYPDHMNYYDGDMDRYFKDKAAIFCHQKAEDTLITTAEIAQLIDSNNALPKPMADRMLVPPLPQTYPLPIPGEHNRLNAALARAATLRCDIPENVIDIALQNFSGVEGRLQFVGTGQDRHFYNDSNATTEDATLAALRSFPPETIVLIFGGADKGLPLDSLMSYIAQHNIRSVLIKGTGSDRVLAIAPSIPVTGSMPEAFAKAMSMSRPQDKIILSPAFASFGVFKNEYDRSDQYLQQVAAVCSTK